MISRYVKGNRKPHLSAGLTVESRDFTLTPSDRLNICKFGFGDHSFGPPDPLAEAFGSPTGSTG